MIDKFRLKNSVWLYMCLLVTVIGCSGCAKEGSVDFLRQIGIREESLLEKTDFWAIYDVGENSYLYEVCDINGNVVWRDILYREPTIKIYDSRYIEVRWGVGTGTWLCKYYDTETCFISQSLEGAMYVVDGLIAFMVDVPQRELHVMNPFSYGDFFQVIHLDFCETMANPLDCILEIKAETKEKIQIDYVSSEGNNKRTSANLDLE